MWLGWLPHRYQRGPTASGCASGGCCRWPLDSTLTTGRQLSPASAQREIEKESEGEGKYRLEKKTRDWEKLWSGGWAGRWMVRELIYWAPHALICWATKEPWKTRSHKGELKIKMNTLTLLYFVLFNILYCSHKSIFLLSRIRQADKAQLLLVMVSYRLWKELWGRINYLTKLETTKPQQGAMQCTREKDRSYVKWDYSALLKYGMKIPYENGWRFQMLDAYWIHCAKMLMICLSKEREKKGF